MELSLRHKVRTFECDKFDNMKADSVMKYMQEAATNQMTLEGLPYDTLLHRGIALLINRMDIEFYQPIKKFDELEFRSWPCREKGATLPRKYSVLKAGEEVAFAIGQWSMVDTSSMKIIRPSEVDFSMYTIEEDNKLTCERFKTPDGLEHLADLRIGYNDVDCNGHLNNTNYLKMVQDYVPELEEGLHISSAKIHFSKEAPLGSSISLFGKRVIEEGHKFYYFKSLIKKDEIENTNCEIKIELV